MQVGILRRRFGRGIASIILACVVSVAVYHLANRLLTIRYIEVVGSGVSVAIDQKKISRNLLLFPGDTLRTKILLDNPILSDVVFQKVYPHTLRIVPVVRLPFARLRTGDRVVLVDASGVVLSDNDASKHLPEVVIPIAHVRIGEKLTGADLASSLALLAGAQGVMEITAITKIDEASLLAKSGITNIYFSQDTPTAGILSTLQTLMTGFRIKGTLPTVVDLRFDKPIVKF